MSKSLSARRAKSGPPSVSTLTSFGAQRLAELLMAAAKRDPSPMRSLALEVAGEGGDVGGEIDRQIARLRKSTGLLNSKKAGSLAGKVRTLANTIVSKLGPEDATGAAERLLALLDLAPELLERRTAGGDTLGEVFRGLSEPIGALLAAVPEGDAKSSVAGSAYRTFMADGYGLAEDLMGCVAAAVSPKERQRLKALIDADWRRGGKLSVIETGRRCIASSRVSMRFAPLRMLTGM